MDEEKFNDFLNRFVGDLGPTVGRAVTLPIAITEPTRLVRPPN
jgi:hypothetical protein